MTRGYEQRTRINRPEVLARYLPPLLAQQFEDADTQLVSPSDQEQQIARLRALLQTIVTYIPAYAQPLRQHTQPQYVGELARPYGTLLSADLSGFTAFSARLNALGSEGAELVARTISQLFATLVSTIERWAGSLLKLSGDALTVLFSGPRHAHYAAAAALELQERMHGFERLPSPVGTFSLQMRIGLASGTLLMAETGSEQRIELLVAGSTAKRAVDIQRMAAPGSVVVDGATYREITSECRALSLAADRYEVTEVSPYAPPPPHIPPVWVSRSNGFWELQALIRRLENLRPYLVPQHFDLLNTGAPVIDSDGDIRTVTVLFACLADSGKLLDQVSDDGATLAQLQQRAVQIWEIVERHGGTVNKLDLHSEGHTLVALFGAPLAQGDDADRAVSCAQALLREAGVRGEIRADDALRVRRVGLASGRVFAGGVGSPTRREYTVMGSVVNLAARLMDLARDGHILIDQATAESVRQRFRLQPQPPVPVKGYDTPIPMFLISTEQRSRLSVLIRERGQMLGRDAELAQARATVADALGGSGQVVVITGEAGIGKTRLLAEVVRGLPVAPGPLIATVQAQPQMSSQPYALIGDLLRQLYELDGSTEQIRAMLAERVHVLAEEQERFLPLLMSVLGLSSQANSLIEALSPDERRARLHDLITALILSSTRNQSTVFILEDLHWADVASLDMLGQIVTHIQDVPLLILSTSRTEGAPQWPDHAPVTSIRLGGVPAHEGEQLLDSWLNNHDLSAQLRAAILERTQGNPLFLIETARAIHAAAEIGVLPLPTTVQGAIQARLDRLSGEDQYLLRLAAVIGAQFSCDILSNIAPRQIALGPTLERLVQHGFLQPDSADNRSYTFTHSLVQETAYESLLFAQRRKLHREVATWMQAHSANDDQYGVLAFHYRRAEAWPEALEYAWRAGNAAHSLYASDVALEQYQYGLQAAQHIGAEADRWRARILRRCGDIHALGGRYDQAIQAYCEALENTTDNEECVEILLGWAETYEQQAAYDQALGLLSQADSTLSAPSDTPLALRIQVRRGWLLVRQGRDDEARATVEPILESLEVQGLWRDVLLAYKVFFHVAVDQGRWSEARAYLRLALKHAEQINDIREIARIHNNIGVVLLHEGQLYQAAESFGQCARIMEEIRDLHNLALIKVNGGVIQYKLGSPAAALQLYETGLQLAMQIGAPAIESIVRNNLGEIYRELHRLPESVNELLKAISLCKASNDDLGLAEAYRQLAETYIVMGYLGKAEQACNQALEHSLLAGDPQTEAIAYRVFGQLAIAQGNDDIAANLVQKSIRMLGELGSNQELAHSLLVQAKVCSLRSQDLDARLLLEEARNLFQKVGATADEQKVEHLLEQLPLIVSVKDTVL